VDSILRRRTDNLPSSFRFEIFEIYNELKTKALLILKLVCPTNL